MQRRREHRFVRNLQRTLPLQNMPDGDSAPFKAGQWIVATLIGAALGGGIGWSLFALIGGYVGNATKKS